MKLVRHHLTGRPTGAGAGSALDRASPFVYSYCTVSAPRPASSRGPDRARQHGQRRSGSVSSTPAIDSSSTTGAREDGSARRARGRGRRLAGRARRRGRRRLHLALRRRRARSCRRGGRSAPRGRAPSSSTRAPSRPPRRRASPRSPRRVVAYLRAPVSGNPAVVRAGNLSSSSPEPPTALERVEPVLRAIGPTIHHVGDGEQARVVKLAINLVIAGLAQLMAEALVLGEAAGVSRAALLEMMGELGRRRAVRQVQDRASARATTTRRRSRRR